MKQIKDEGSVPHWNISPTTKHESDLLSMHCCSPTVLMKCVGHLKCVEVLLAVTMTRQSHWHLDSKSLGGKMSCSMQWRIIPSQTSKTPQRVLPILLPYAGEGDRLPSLTFSFRDCFKEGPRSELLITCQAGSPGPGRSISLTSPAYMKAQHFSNICPYINPLWVAKSIFQLETNPYKLNSNLILEFLLGWSMILKIIIIAKLRHHSWGLLQRCNK